MVQRKRIRRDRRGTKITQRLWVGIVGKELACEWLKLNDGMMGWASVRRYAQDTQLSYAVSSERTWLNPCFDNISRFHTESIRLLPIWWRSPTGLAHSPGTGLSDNMMWTNNRSSRRKHQFQTFKKKYDLHCTLCAFRRSTGIYTNQVAYNVSLVSTQILDEFLS